MSDPGNNSRRGPLPRTNRPRADSVHGKPARASDEHPSGPQSSPDGVPVDASAAKPADPNAEATLRHSAVIGNVHNRETARALAERPTQLDTQGSAASRTPAPPDAGPAGSAPSTQKEAPASGYIGTHIDGRYRIDTTLG